jgi:hypothetical protein
MGLSHASLRFARSSDIRAGPRATPGHSSRCGEWVLAERPLVAGWRPTDPTGGHVARPPANSRGAIGTKAMRSHRIAALRHVAALAPIRRRARINRHARARRHPRYLSAFLCLGRGQPSRLDPVGNEGWAMDS